MSFHLARSFADHRDHRRSSQEAAQPRTASHGIARLCHSGLPNMGGLVLYMVTCIYTLRADQGSLESISKDFPCVSLSGEPSATQGCPYRRYSLQKTLDRLTARIPTFRFRAYDSNDSSDSEPAQSAPCSPPSLSRPSTLPPTLETDAMDAERLQNIEEGLRQQVAANRSTQEMLARLFDKFNNLELPNLPISQPIIAPPNLITHAAPPHRSRVKPGAPQNFDGDREGGRSFLTSCQLYISLSIDNIADDQAQIHWALSYFKSGRAATHPAHRGQKGRPE